MGEMLAHRRPEMTPKAGQRLQGVECFTRVRFQQGADNRGHAAPIGGAEWRPWGLPQYALAHQPRDETLSAAGACNDASERHAGPQVTEPDLQGRTRHRGMRGMGDDKLLELSQVRARCRLRTRTPEGQRLDVLPYEGLIIIRPAAHGIFSPVIGMSRQTSRKSSVASLRYMAVAAGTVCPKRSPMAFIGTKAQSKPIARAWRKVCGPRLTARSIPAFASLPATLEIQIDPPRTS